MPSLLTYVKEDRSETVSVWTTGYTPTMLALPDGSSAHLTGSVPCETPPEGSYLFVSPPPGDFLEKTKRWWNDGIYPFPDPVVAKQIRGECATFDELYARMEYAITDEKVLVTWTST